MEGCQLWVVPWVGMSSAANLGCSANRSAAWAMWFRRPYGVDDVRDGKCCSVASPGKRITTQVLGVLEQGHATCSGELYAFWEIAPSMLLGPVRAEILDHRAPSDCSFRIAHLSNLLDSPSHRVEQAQQQSTVKWKWNVWDWGQVGLEGMSKERGQVTQTPCAHHLYTSAPPSAHSYGHLCRNLIQPDEEGRKAKFGGELAWYVNASWKWTAVALQPNSGLALKDSGDKSLPNKQSWEQCIWSLTLCGRKSSRRWENIQIPRQVPMAQPTE